MANKPFPSPNHLLLLITLLAQFSIISAQPPAMTPAPPGPTNITAILEKAGQFTTLIKLLKSTQVGDQLNTQLNNSNQGGMTLFAPTDNAFTNLKIGMLNSLTDQEKLQLIQFHLVPQFISTSQFQTVSNPLRTQAGGGEHGQFPLNVTSSGNQVNVTSGVVNSTVGNTVYTDGKLAVYQVDKVLLPLQFFSPPAQAPAPSLTDKKDSSSDASSGDASDSTSADSSAAIALIQCSSALSGAFAVGLNMMLSASL